MTFNNRYILFKFDDISLKVIDKYSKKKISYKLLLDILKEKFFSITNNHSNQFDQTEILEYEQEFSFERAEVIRLLEKINESLRNDFVCLICEKGKLTMSISENAIICSFCKTMIPDQNINQFRYEISNLDRDHRRNCDLEPSIAYSLDNGILKSLDYLCHSCLICISIINPNRL